MSRNVERQREHAREWARRNRDKMRAYWREYSIRNRERLREKSIRYREASGPEKMSAIARRAFQKAYTSNKEKYLSWAAEHKRSRARRVCAWANQTLVRAFYAEARRLTAETGCKHHVDHVIPLKNPKVSGLHNEFNLRVIPAVENWRKHNKCELINA